MESTSEDRRKSMNAFEMVAVIALIIGIIAVLGHVFDQGIREPFQGVVAILIVIFFSRILMHFFGVRGRWGRGGRCAAPAEKADVRPYLDKIETLEKRIRVLERIVTDKSHNLAREIDELDQ
jgi:Na+/melibiose symporter-like transporter